MSLSYNYYPILFIITLPYSSLITSLNPLLPRLALPCLELQTRWAWGREEISQLEKNLAPRVIPTYCLARVLVLCCLSWLLLILNTITITLVPVMMGRTFFSLAQFPLKVQHDPVAYIVGACVCLTIVTLTRSITLFCLNAQKFKGFRKSLFSIPLQAVIKSKSFYTFTRLSSIVLSQLLKWH